MASDTDQGPSKRPRSEAKSGRRALSCTECKRRKTKCSALGKTPCDSCIKRGRPGDCYWEDAPEQPAYALASDLDALRAELRDLRALVYSQSHTHSHSHTGPSTHHPSHTSNGGSTVHSPYTAPKGPQRRKDGIEVTVSTLEDTIVGVGPGSRPKKRSQAPAPWDTAAQRQVLIDTAISMLPHRTTCAALLDEFFTGPVHLCWYVMDERTFRERHAAFEAGEVDASWLALYLIVLAISTKISPNMAALFPGYSESDMELIPQALYQSSLNALEAAEYLAVPQLRHIQCAILYVVTLFHFGDDDDDVKRQNIVLRHLDAAVSTLLWLDLDIMTDDWNTAPLDDPALAGLSPHAAHELCKQLAHIVQFMDTTIPRRRSIWRLMNMTTPIPANRKVPSDVDYPELPTHVVTPAGLPRSANAFCVTLHKYHNDSAELTHEQTMEYDHELRHALAQVPPPASLETSWMLHMVITSVNNRILRAHRPFLMRSVNDPSLEVSRRACVESARRIVEAQLVFNAKPRIRPRFAVRWVLGAVVVLAMDYVLGNMDSRTSLLQARDVFSSVIGPRSKHCVKALDALVYAADVKTGTVRADTDLCSFFELVKEKLANTDAPQGAMNMLFPGLDEFDFEGMLSVEIANEAATTTLCTPNGTPAKVEQHAQAPAGWGHVFTVPPVLVLYFAMSFVPPEHDARRIPSPAAAAAGPPSITASIPNADANEKVLGAAPEVGTLHRSLKSRHVQMIAIGGVIGTGLFIGTATNLQNAGPAGLLLSYVLMATLLYSVMVALGEMISAFPIPGAQLALAGRFFAPEVGFAIGWLYWYCYIILLPAELSAAAVIITYWTPAGADPTCRAGVCSNALWVSIMLAVVILANVVGSTRVFGEIEFWAASIKVITIIGLIIISVVITSGGGPTGAPIGFRYWHETGGFVQYKDIPGAWGRFLGFFSVLISAAFAFIGTEITAVAAAEAGNPARTVPRAIRSVWLRLALFYVASAFLIGLLVSPSNPDLNLGSTAAKSPFVIAIKGAGIRVLPSVINAALLSSAWSAAIADLYISSRTLYGLYTRGAARGAWLGRTRRDGLPWVCVLLCALFTPLAYFAAAPSRSAGQAFGYFASMCAVCGMLSWSVILLTSIRWHYGLRARGIDRNSLPYTAPFQPYLSYYGLALSGIVIVFSGFTAFIHRFDTSAFITTYFGIPFFAVLLVGYKVWNKTGLVAYEDMDFTTGYSGTDESKGERKGWLAKLSV